MKKVKFLLTELTFFVPDVFLVIAIASFFYNFGQYDILISILLFIAYIALVYGEKYFHRLQVSKEMVDNLINSIEELNKDISYNRNHYITIEGIVRVAEILEDDYTNKIAELRAELKGDVEDGKVD